MSEPLNKARSAEDVKTSTNKSQTNPDNTADSQVQDGTGVIQAGHHVMPYDKNDTQQEYVDDKNNTLKQKK